MRDQGVTAASASRMINLHHTNGKFSLAQLYRKAPSYKSIISLVHHLIAGITSTPRQQSFWQSTSCCRSAMS